MIDKWKKKLQWNIEKKNSDDDNQILASNNP